MGFARPEPISFHSADQVHYSSCPVPMPAIPVAVDWDCARQIILQAIRTAGKYIWICHIIIIKQFYRVPMQVVQSLIFGFLFVRPYKVLFLSIFDQKGLIKSYFR